MAWLKDPEVNQLQKYKNAPSEIIQSILMQPLWHTLSLSVLLFVVAA